MVPGPGFWETTLPDPSIFILSPVRLIISIAFLRLLPLIPFFVVNLVMGLTSVRTVTFFWVSQLGMLPATIVYVNAGLQLNNLNSISDVYSIEFIISFLILAIFPFLVKKILSKINKNRV